MGKGEGEHSVSKDTHMGRGKGEPSVSEDTHTWEEGRESQC